ncbi:hypothetical protein SCHPADRAFT_925865 [Schizopora paradoxa]|uniref:J domain-containing protein n=1 Tax=Schizopora paradoxa TaxID=27342 RepID=A0A0H2SJT7_9AGAM|nr:hypothetical protein SCHPADRAFT_925865 [Schizopora paradoxa]
MRLIPHSLAVLIGSAFAYASDAPESGSALYPPGLQPLISKANLLLSSGHYADAARTYTEAIEQSPIDYTLYYRRGTAYYSLSRHSQSLADFEKVMELSSASGGFDKAILMQGRIHLKLGSWPEARAALKSYSSRISAAKDKEEAATLQASLTAAEASASRAQQSKRAGLNQACVDAVTDAIRVASHSADLRALRAECSLAAGDVQGAVGDLVRLTHLVQAASSAMLTDLASLSYFLLPPSTQAAGALKQCLHSDPDSKVCAKLHKKIKALDKAFAKVSTARENGDWRAIISSIIGSSSSPGLLQQFTDALNAAFPSEKDSSSKLPPALLPPKAHSPQYKHLIHQLCLAHTKLNMPAKGLQWCEELLSTFRPSGGNEEGSVDVTLSIEEEKDAYVGRGEAKLGSEDWEEAVRAFEKAWEVAGRGDQDVAQRLQKAQRLLKQSRSKDYYKVLGVARDADERTIKKAYRKAAKTAHPDKGGSEEKMAAVNEAYEVLSDPELRARFDNGDDPNDPTAQSGGHPFFFQGGSHPFAQFFQQSPGGGGGGGNGGFQFHFGNAGPRQGRRGH